MSNGGSATFWFISNAPELFAGFYAFSAYPGLQVGGIEFSNITEGKPLYSVHAKDDRVYKYAAVKDIYEQYKVTAMGWHLETLDSGGHGFIYGDNGEKIIGQVMDRLLFHK